MTGSTPGSPSQETELGALSPPFKPDPNLNYLKNCGYKPVFVVLVSTNRKRTLVPVRLFAGDVNYLSEYSYNATTHRTAPR